ncbi:capsular polysaccharide export protein, LipB/KpsS family [Salinimicrobium sp. HB62]|uniref:capsular polysaccharide export protein, LipB/KpsS family n=1 Tax=Salinimicrobium sp. HB62 TaxID=3077781 RepID=UPI002D79790E|nr:hypothetical protein [Salinimicrobium sp. HB62]
MKNILVAQIHALGTFARGVMLETLQDLIDENPDAKIYYLTCSNTYNVCYINTEKEPEVCYVCKKGVKKGMDLIKGDYIHLEIEDILLPEDKELAQKFIEENPVINKEVWFKDYEVGEAAVSSYISKTRDKNLNGIHDSFAYDLVENDVALYNALDRFFDEIKFSQVYNFNGRNSYQRAVLNISKKYGVECINKEIARTGGIVETFRNELPHHIETKVNLINRAWEKKDITTDEKEKIGRSFFENKVKGIYTNDKIYTKNQESNKVPENVDYSRRTFVIFTSSDDEFAAVGKDFINPYFKDQNEGIAYVARLVAQEFPQCNLMIRMHPNLTGLDHDYVKELRNMEKIGPNIHVIAPESSVDSYALLNIANKVIVFGSTIGLEANFWRKPVILLGKCFWYYQDVAYVPKQKEELKELLEQNLDPKPTEDAIKFGFYFLRGGEEAKYFYNDVESGASYKGVPLYKLSLTDRLKAKFIQQAHRRFKVRLFVK